MQLSEIEKLVNSHSSAKERREILVHEMERKESLGENCHSCSGMCCTYEFNSMKITPLEAFDVLDYLSAKAEFHWVKLKEILESNIQHFRLDKEFASLGGKSFRRYYTCPFYKGESLGCMISKHKKPYGCIAFNPMHKNVSVSNKCTSQLEKLEEREQKYSQEEDELNQKLREKLNIYWETQPISTAVLELLNKLYSVASS